MGEIPVEIFLRIGIGVVFLILLILGIIIYYRRKINKFSEELSEIIDRMLTGGEVSFQITEETLSNKLSARLKRLYEREEAHVEEAKEEKNKMQELLSDISHQVKTPIASIKMYHEILLERELEKDKQKEFLTQSKQQVEKLDFLLQSMIKMSRLEQGVILLQKSYQPIKETLALALNSIVLKAGQKEIDVSVDCEDNLSVWHDTKWTAECFFNILENAVKYTNPKGKIKISVKKEEFYVVVSIKDNGIGINEQEQSCIFKRFYRSSKVHQIEGVGLGLFLAREIISKQNGYMMVKSEESQGSEFMVFLPSDV